MISDLLYPEVDLENHEELKQCYTLLYNEYIDLAQKYDNLNGTYSILLNDFELLNSKHELMATEFSKSILLLEEKVNTIDDLVNEIETMIVLIEVLSRKKNPLLNFDIFTHIGFNQYYFGSAGLSWMPIQYKRLKVGVFGNLGYALFNSVIYSFGIKVNLSLF